MPGASRSPPGLETATRRTRAFSGRRREERLTLADVTRRADFSIERKRPVELRVRLRASSFFDELLRRPQSCIRLAGSVAEPAEDVSGEPEFTGADRRG